MAVTLVAALAVPALRHWREAPPPSPAAMHAVLPLPADLTIWSGAGRSVGLAAAPDSRRLVFPATRDGQTQLWLHDLTTGDTTPLAGTDDAVQPFWSPDGRRLGFFAAEQLRVLDVDARAVEDIVEWPDPLGASWVAADEMLLGSRRRTGIVRLRPSDGSSAPITTVDLARGERAHGWPRLTDDGAAIVFYVDADQATRGGIWTMAAAGGDAARLVASDAAAWPSRESLLFAVDGSLMLQRFDASRGRLIGRTELVAGDVGVSSDHALAAAVTPELLVYAGGTPDAREFVWFDRSGAPLRTLAGPVSGTDVRIAPSGRRVAAAHTDPQLGTLDVWVYDDDRALPNRVSTALDVDDAPVWSPAGDRLAWVAGRRRVMVRAATLASDERAVRLFDGRVRLWDWDRTDRLVLSATDTATREDLWLLPLRPDDAAPVPYLRTPFSETAAAVSPDGRWLAYAADDAGHFDVYVDRYPAPRRRIRVSMTGGSSPRWVAPDTLVFRRDATLYAATLTVRGDEAEAADVQPLMDLGRDVRSFDITRDGGRVVINRPAAAGRAPDVRLLANWREPALPVAPPRF